MAVSASTPDVASQTYPADLLAKTLNITAEHSTSRVYVSAVCENLGPGRVSGPFSIAVAVDLTRGGVLTSYVQTFVVPADVTLAGGPPVFEAEIARAPGLGSAFQTTYVTGSMEVPLHFRDEDPSAIYDAEFLVDADYQVPDPNRVNNSFKWGGVNGTFWFISRAARERKGPFVVERSLSGHAG